MFGALTIVAVARFAALRTDLTLSEPGAVGLLLRYDLLVDPLEAEQGSGMIDLKDREFASGVHEAFQPRWEEAEVLQL